MLGRVHPRRVLTMSLSDPMSIISITWPAGTATEEIERDTRVVASMISDGVVGDLCNPVVEVRVRCEPFADKPMKARYVDGEEVEYNAAS